MRITEKQIRRIIRETLSGTSKLIKEAVAKNWDEYVEMTLGKGIDNPEIMKDTYQKILSFPTWEEDYMIWLKDYGFIVGQGPEYGDYRKWYFRFNDSAAGKELRGSNKWTTPDDIISVLEYFANAIDSGEVSAMSAEEGEGPRKEAAKKEKLKILKKIKEKKQQRKMNKTARRSGAKGGDKELDKYDKAAEKTRKNREKAEKAKNKQSLGDRVKNLNIDVPSAADSGSGGSF